MPPFRTYLVLSLAFFLIASLLQSPLVTFVGNDTAVEQSRDGDVDASCENIELDRIGIPYRPEWEAAFRVACANILADSEAVNRAFIDNIPVMMFFFIPFVAIIMKGLYLLSRRLYIEHLLFLIHYHAFFFMTLTGIVILTAIGNAFPSIEEPIRWLNLAAWLYILIYLLVALRRVYAEGWLRTSIKCGVLIVGYALSLMIALSAAGIYSALKV